MKNLDRFSDGTRIRVRIVNIDGGWTERQALWLKKRQDKDVLGYVEVIQGCHYFRPDRCNFILLRDYYVRILGKVEEVLT